MIVECDQCLWQGTIEEWEDAGGQCPTCYCVVFKVIENKYE